MCGDVRAQAIPVPPFAGCLDAPHVMLQHALAHRAAGVRLICALHLGELHRGTQTGEIDTLENLAVQLLGLRAVERHAQQDERVRQALHAHANGAVTHVGAPGSLHWVEVDVNDLVQVLGHMGCHLSKLVKVKVPVGRIQGPDKLLALPLALCSPLAHEAGQSNAGQVAHGCLLRTGELNDLSTQVTALDGPQVLLVALAVAGVLVQDVRVASLDLSLQHCKPQLLSTDCTLGTALTLVPCVQLIELLSPAVGQAGCLVGAEHAPVFVGLHSLHEQIVDPQAIEQVTGTSLLLSMVLAQVKPVKHVCVPRLHVDGKGALALATTLIHISGSVIEDAQHGHNTVGLAVGATDVAASGANVVNGQPNATCTLGDSGTLLEGVIDAFNGVVLHTQQEARGQLWVGCATVE
mmetsp:Transcript_989/g.1567  ORF Transcript_989/g.1567 Transcript_989/m.1567 type:complete len:407 (+) Transcript_989:1659-2879(+)